jgi:hypothetical protein
MAMTIESWWTVIPSASRICRTRAPGIVNFIGPLFDRERRALWRQRVRENAGANHAIVVKIFFRVLHAMTQSVHNFMAHLTEFAVRAISIARGAHPSALKIKLGSDR